MAVAVAVAVAGRATADSPAAKARRCCRSCLLGLLAGSVGREAAVEPVLLLRSKVAAVAAEEVVAEACSWSKLVGWRPPRGFAAH